LLRWPRTDDVFDLAFDALFQPALSGTDAVVVAAAVNEAVDFGAGPLAGRGGQDLVVARVRR